MKKYNKDLDELSKFELEELESTRDDIFDIESVIFAGKTFVLTGTFTIGKRSQVKDLIEDAGGIVKRSFTLTADYLVVGEMASQDWKYGNYGTKIERALKAKKEKKLPIKIISEQNLIQSLKPDSNGKDIFDTCKDAVFERFLEVDETPIIKLEAYLAEEDEFVTIDFSLDNSIREKYNIDDIDIEQHYYLMALFDWLKKRVLYLDSYIGEIKYFYNCCKNIVDKGEFKDKLYQFVTTSIKNNIREKRTNFDTFADIECLKESLYTDEYKKYLEDKAKRAEKARIMIKLSKIIEEYEDLLKLLMYVAKADGRLTKEEKTIIIDTFKKIDNNIQNLQEMIDIVNKRRIFFESYNSFIKDAREIIKKYPQIDFFEFAKNIVDTDKKIHKEEEKILKYLAKFYNKELDPKYRLSKNVDSTKESKRRNIIMAEIRPCPTCNSTDNVIRKGQREYKKHISYRYWCKKCGKIFTVKKDKNLNLTSV